jgi:oligopeptide transport system ATP-binding protein
MVDLVVRMRDQMGMAIIWITHDLGVVAGLAERVVVMYAGYIVEEAPVDDLYADPQHPYTMALLQALPRVDRRRSHERLKSIPGAPPNLLVEPKGCPFVPRCEYAFDRCIQETPVLEFVAEDHRTACWYDVMTGGPR